MNLQGALFSLIDHKDAMVAIVYRVSRLNKEPLILKICDHSKNYFREVHFLKNLAGILPIPKIIKVVEPTKEMHEAILIESLAGNLLITEELSETLAYEIGQSLAFIHHNRVSGYGDSLQHQLDSDPSVYVTLKFEEGLDECKDHLPKKLIEQCRSYYKESVNPLKSVDGPCIVHRDFRQCNLMVDAGKLQAIIDWAGARFSFAEEDFCPFEHGESPIQPSIKKAFLDGYATIRPVHDYEPIVPFLSPNKAVAIVGFTVKRGIWKTNSHMYQYNRQFIETFFK